MENQVGYLGFHQQQISSVLMVFDEISLKVDDSIHDFEYLTNEMFNYLQALV